MNPTIAVIVLVVYYISMSFILVYACFQFLLALKYIRAKKQKETTPAEPSTWPRVTIQLPVYNELYVVERLLAAVAAIDYPKDKLQVQLIDDSTDESFEVGAARIAALQHTGFNAAHVRRKERTGYKAGALQYALSQATGEFIAIFDADFVPKPDFLKRTIPWFADERIGVVQTKWGHLNRNFSLLTKLQALALDLHFSIEQRGRNASGYFMNFNGTAGVWRGTAILDAGGWRDVTLTEDLDLSYRAQLKGWKFKYMEDMESPAELPIEINALKSQQYRWNKGGAETARLMLPGVLKSKLPLETKLHAMVHLLNSSVYLFVLSTTMLSVPFVFAQTALPHVDLSAGYIFLLALGLLTFAYVTSFRGKERPGQYALEYPLFLSLSLGLALHNALAVIKGFIGKRSPFIRTPKFNVTGSNAWKNNKYLMRHIKPLTWFEGLMAAYLGVGIIADIRLGTYGLLPFHVMAAFGFAAIFYYSLRHAYLASRT